MASRSENFEKIIKKNHKKKIILIDRFTDSTIAYQHYGMGIDKYLIGKINNFILGKIKPDLTFLNLVNKNNLRSRLKKRANKNKYDKFAISFYKKVQNGFKKLSKSNGKYIIVNSNNSIEDNKKLVVNTIKKIL